MSEDALSQVFGALADPTRRAILARLDKGEASVTELAAPFDMSMPAISKHLKVLERAGLITRGREAQWRPCRLQPAAFKDATDWLERYRQYWDTSLDRHDVHLKNIQKGSRNDCTATRIHPGTRLRRAPRSGLPRVDGARAHESMAAEHTAGDHLAGPARRWHVAVDDGQRRDGTRYPTVAEFREIVDPERLVFNWGDGDNRTAVITVTFDEHDAGTRLTLHLVGPAEFITDESGVEKGWSELLDSLERFLSRRVTR